ncbi:MAG: zf-HC2 domain-containing protein [Lachnospirales bacterium]
MDCGKVCNKMYDYIEHQLPQAEIIEFEEHMKGCKQCQDEYYKLEKIIVKLKNIKDIEPPSNLKYKILDSIKSEEKEHSKKAKIIYFKKYSYVAATMIFFIGGFYILKSIENSPAKNDIYNVTNATNYINEQTNNIDISTETTSEIKTQETINENVTEEIKEDLNLNMPRVASQEPKEDDKSQEIEIFKNSRSLNENNSENYLYEKTILEDSSIQNFKYDIALYKNEICNVYFENNSEENVALFVENIDGNKVSEETIVEKKSNNNMEFYMTEEDLEQGVYTINIKAINENNIDGHLKIEILQKSN